MDPSLFNSTPMDPLNVTDSSHCTRCLSGLACLTSVHSDCLPSCSLWHQCCSLAVALSSCSRRNFSLAFSRFIGIQLHGEESSITFSKSCVQIRNVRVPSFPFVQLNGHTYANRQIDRHTHASCNAVPLVWGSLRLTPINILGIGIACCLQVLQLNYKDQVNAQFQLCFKGKVPCV